MLIACIAAVAALVAAVCGMVMLAAAKGQQESAFAALAQQVEDLREQVEALQKGAAPDYEKARAAAKAVNDFNDGISAILGYDPMEEARRRREEAKK